MSAYKDELLMIAIAYFSCELNDARDENKHPSGHKKRKLEDTSFKTSDESDDDVKLIKIDQDTPSHTPFINQKLEEESLTHPKF